MRRALLLAAALCAAAPASGQVDPERRRLLQLGYDQPLSGPGPVGAYFFYYMNQPRFVRRDTTLRLALSPVYADSELAMARGPVPGNFIGLGLAGGGFADGYSEVRAGRLFKGESFNGSGVKVTASLYRTLNPGQKIPLNLIARTGGHVVVYSKRSDTRSDFTPAPDHGEYFLRLGLRLGGSPPELMPARAGEVSIWYASYLRDHSGPYGFSGDRTLERFSQLFWSRAMVAYRLNSGRRFEVGLQGGTSVNADRLDAYRLGGMLPFASEFPLSIGGYFNGELSAKRYGLLSARYSGHFDETQSYLWRVFGDAANVGYLQGLEQRNAWNSGVGAGAGYESKDGVWLIDLNYAYGVEAIRSGRRGAHSVSLMTQVDLEVWRHGKSKTRRPAIGPSKPEGLEWLPELFKP